MLHKVTMELTTRDVEITEELTKRLKTANNASTVSAALGFMDALAQRVDDGGTLLVRASDGEIGRLVIPGLTRG